MPSNVTAKWFQVFRVGVNVTVGPTVTPAAVKYPPMTVVALFQ